LREGGRGRENLGRNNQKVTIQLHKRERGNIMIKGIKNDGSTLQGIKMKKEVPTPRTVNE